MLVGSFKKRRVPTRGIGQETVLNEKGGGSNEQAITNNLFALTKQLRRQSSWFALLFEVFSVVLDAN